MALCVQREYAVNDKENCDMNSLNKIRLTIDNNTILAFNTFCEEHDISYFNDEVKFGNIHHNWIFLSKKENLQLVNNYLTIYDHMNVPGVYALGYGPGFRSFTSKNCIYIGESSSKYSRHLRTGVHQRIQMAVKDFIGMASNHNGKFLGKRSDIAYYHGDSEFDLTKLCIAFRPHEEYAKWDKSYSHKMEIIALEKFKNKHGKMPLCNHMSGTFTI